MATGGALFPSISRSDPSGNYKLFPISSAGEETADNIVVTGSIGWLGPTERAILEAIYRGPVAKPFRLAMLRSILVTLGYGHISSKALWAAARRLVEKGILVYDPKKRWYYLRDPQTIPILLNLPVRDTRNNGGSSDCKKHKGSEKRSEKRGNGSRVAKRGGEETQGTGIRRLGCGFGVGCVCVGCFVEGPFFDNVRGYLDSGRYVNGDRGRVLEWWHVEALFDDPGDLRFAEVQYRVRGVVMEGYVKVYTNVGDLARFGGCARVEYVPPEGFVKDVGRLDAVVEKAFREYVKAWVALTRVLLYMSAQNVEYLREFASAVRSIGSLVALLKMGSRRRSAAARLRPQPLSAP